MADVFCDDLRVSVPLESWDEISAEIGAVLADTGLGPEFESETVKAWRGGNGTARSERMGRVRVLSVSGATLAGLRLAKQFGRYLSALGSVPHKVTGLHATLDVRESTPEVLARLVAKAESDDGLRAGRKRIPVQSMQRYLTRLPDGRDTGSIYCGSKSVEIRPVVYDKRRERLDKGGADLGFDLTRYELRLRGVGATLRDAYDPEAVFWHYMAPDFLPAPLEVPAWVPNGEGFVVPRAEPTLPAVRLLRRVEASDDFADLVRLAGTFPGGVDFLCGLVRRLDRGNGPEGVQGMSPAAAAVLPATAGRASDSNADNPQPASRPTALLTH